MDTALPIPFPRTPGRRRGRTMVPLALMASVAAIMGVVGLLAAFGPARRGLRIQPMEALREE